MLYLNQVDMMKQTSLGSELIAFGPSMAQGSASSPFLGLTAEAQM